MAITYSFDVLGTSFGFETAITAVQTHLGPRLQAIGVDPKTLFFSWFYAAQRDFTYTSLAGHYVPIAKVLKATLKRACLIVDLPPEQAPTDDEVEAIMAAVKSLEARPGLKKCIDGLREAGAEVYAVTNGGKETSLAYYRAGGIDMDAEHLLSCDEIQVAKPDARVYGNVNKHLDARSLGGGQQARWFVAAHAWDLIAARKAGFKTVYLDFEEHDPATEVFGQFDVYAKSMEDLLEQITTL
jgi:2-haloacid dehalogenase